MPGIEELIGVSIGGSILLTIVCICGSLLFTGATIAGTFWLIRRMTAGDKEVRQSGLPTTATILAIYDTGVRVNSGMQIRIGFKLQVTPPGGGEPYQADTKALIPSIMLASFQPGTTVRVRVHPTDPSRVELDLGATGTPGMVG